MTEEQLRSLKVGDVVIGIGVHRGVVTEELHDDDGLPAFLVCTENAGPMVIDSYDYDLWELDDDTHSIP
jgi:hypothetical protein